MILPLLSLFIDYSSFGYDIYFFRQLENLERSVSNDVRLILALLTQQNTQIIPDINLVSGREPEETNVDRFE